MAHEDRHQDDLSSEQKRPIKIPLRLKKIATHPKNNPLSTWTKKTLKGYWWQLRCRSRCKASRAKGGSFDALLETWNFKFEFVPEKKCLAKFQPSTPTLRQTESSPSTVACEKWSIVVGSGYMAPKKQIGGIHLWRGVLKSKTWLNHEFMPLVFCNQSNQSEVSDFSTEAEVVGSNLGAPSRQIRASHSVPSLLCCMRELLIG